LSIIFPTSLSLLDPRLRAFLACFPTPGCAESGAVNGTPPRRESLRTDVMPVPDTRPGSSVETAVAMVDAIPTDVVKLSLEACVIEALHGQLTQSGTPTLSEVLAYAEKVDPPYARLLRPQILALNEVQAARDAVFAVLHELCPKFCEKHTTLLKWLEEATLVEVDEKTLRIDTRKFTPHPANLQLYRAIWVAQHPRELVIDDATLGAITDVTDFGAAVDNATTAEKLGAFALEYKASLNTIMDWALNHGARP